MSAILSAAQPHILENSMFYRRLLSILQPKSRVTMRLACAVLLIGVSPVLGAADVPAREDVPMMTSPLVDESGAAFAMADLGDGPVLLNFWASWCAPCIAELPALGRAAAALADDGVTILLVSIDRGGANKALPFLETHGVAAARNMKFGFDPRAKLTREMGVRGLPTSFVLPSGQQAAWRFVGPFEWDELEMLEMIRALVSD